MDPREELLATLRAPHPPAVDGWPPGPGWWIALAIAVVALGVLVAVLRQRRARRHRTLAWQRAARSAIVTLRRRLDREPPSVLLGEASVLARRTLLAVRPRTRVAALHGQAWLETLDGASGGTRFTAGPARALASAPFERDPSMSRDELAEVLDALDALVTALARPPEPGDAPARAAGRTSGASG